MFGKRKRSQKAPRSNAATPPRTDPAPAEHDAVPDVYLPALSEAGARELEALAVRSFREAGVDASVRDGLVSTTDDRQFGLHNLAVQVANAHRDEWEEVVRSHVAAALDDQPLPTGAEAFDRFVLQLWDTSVLPEAVQQTAREFAPGVSILPGIDLPTKVHYFLDEDQLEPFGGWEVVEPAALRNLRELQPPHHSSLFADDAAQASLIHLFETDDLFGASRVLILSGLLAGAGIRSPDHGLLVAVPNRHLLVVHVVTGPDVFRAVQALAALADGESGDDVPGPISSHVYFLSAGGAPQQITQTRDGQREIVIEGALLDTLDALGVSHDE